MTDKVQIIQVPNTLRAKVGGKLGVLDQGAIEKAELALADLSTQFHGWLLEEIKKLEDRHDTIKREGISAQAMEQLYFTSHDLKGLGTTYGYPLITRIAGSMCKMFDDDEHRMQAPKILIDAHIDAIRAAVRDEIRSDTHPVGKILVETLEERVAEFLKKIEA